MGTPEKGPRLTIKLLGPLEVSAADHPLDVGGHRQRVVLALLALEAGHVVPTERLVDAIYELDPPPTARVQVQICVSALRRSLTAAGCPDAIVTHQQGYALRVEGAVIDVRCFEALVADARRLRGDGRGAEAVDQYRKASRLWRGPAMAGLESGLLRRAAIRLDEFRVDVTEDLVELELGLGRYREAWAELAVFVERHPLRERLHGQLMVALYRGGRQAEALEVYRRLRRRLVDELGIEPDAVLQRLEQAILRGEAEPAAAAERSVTAQDRWPEVPSVPRLLPIDVADFTGRSAQLDQLERLLAGGSTGSAGRPVPVVVVGGRPGVGKTTLGVHAAHRLADRFPDGQLFVDLRGQSARPLDATQALERFLRVLGVPGAAVPAGLDERAELYRHLLSGRAVLVMLDNASDESQVQALLPGTGGSAVLITSRSRLAGLPGAVYLPLDVFDLEHSVRLLARVADVQMDQGSGDAGRLAALCGHLPLALRVAGARLRARPHWTVGHLVERLGDEARRLDELHQGTTGIRPSIGLSYEALGTDARRLFRRLTLVNFSTFGKWLAGALLDRQDIEAADLLDDLAEAHLLDPVATKDSSDGQHYRFHDLIRVFAGERLLAEETADDRTAALSRALWALLHLTEQAGRRIARDSGLRLPGHVPVWPVPDHFVELATAAPRAWLEGERGNIVAAVRQSADVGLTQLCWQLAYEAVVLFGRCGYRDDWRETHRIALGATERAGDRAGRAVMLYSLGSLYNSEWRLDQAGSALTQARSLFQTGEHQHYVAQVDIQLAVIDRYRGNLDLAERRYGSALRMLRDRGEWSNVAYVLQSLAQIRLDRGVPRSAQRLLDEALDLTRRGGSRRTEAQVLCRIGQTYLQLSDPIAAAGAFQQALVVAQGVGDTIGTAHVLSGLGVARLRAGELAESETTLYDALRCATTAGDQVAEVRTLLGLAQLSLCREDWKQADAQLERARELSARLGLPALTAELQAVVATANNTGHATSGPDGTAAGTPPDQPG